MTNTSASKGKSYADTACDVCAVAYARCQDTIGVRPRKANWARLIQRVDEVDPLEYLNCGAPMRIIALIDDAEVIERIRKHLNVWQPLSF